MGFCPLQIAAIQLILYPEILHNYAHYKDNVPEASVYPLVKDAVTAAFRLGFVYMWIDAYCIIQDDEKDWQEQAKCSRFSQYLISQSH